MLKSIETYEIHNPEFVKYIPILDRDPVYAARFIVKAKLRDYYKLLRSVFCEIINKDRKHEILYDTVTSSRENFRWFRSFYREMEKLLNIKDKLIFPVKGGIYPTNTGKAPEVMQPYNYSTQGTGKPLKLEFRNTNAKKEDPINNYRILYILKEYEMHEFQEDVYPAWYLLKNTTIFEQYDERTNRRVRVDIRDGDLFYFIAGASDNWRMIADVPKEMDYIISALIFRHNN